MAGLLRLTRALAPVLLLALFVGTLLSASPARAQMYGAVIVVTTSTGNPSGTTTDTWSVTVTNNGGDPLTGSIYVDGVSATSTQVVPDGFLNTAFFTVGPLSAGTHTFKFGDGLAFGPPQTVNVSAPLTSQTITLNVNPGSLTYNGVANLSVSGKSGSGAVSYQVTAGSCTIVSGTTLKAGTTTETCSVTAKIEADGTYAAATSSPVSVSVSAPASASQTITVAVSKTSLFYKGTATLSASGYSGTGAITYATTALCSITGTTLTAVSTSAGTCLVTATIAASPGYTTATSTAVIVTLQGLPDPSADVGVKEVLTYQRDFAGNVIVSMTGSVLNVLDLNGLKRSLGTSVMVILPQRQGYAPDEPGPFGTLARSPAVAALDKKVKAAPAKAGASPEPDYKIWMSGSLAADIDRVQGVPDKMRATRQATIVGLHTRLSEGMIVGMAFGGFAGDSKFDLFGGKEKSLAWSATAYGSLRLADDVVLDSVLGYGGLQFKSTRYNADAAGLLTGSRNGDMVFGALRVSWNQQAGQLIYAPYARFDVSHVWLNKYAEQGDANWNLAFDKTTVASQAFVLGFRTQYDIPNGNGTVSPTLRVEYRHTFNGDMTQTMNYVADPATRYSLTLDGSKRDAVTGAIGLKAQGDGALSGQIEYSAGMALQGGGFAGQGLRGSIRLGF